MSSAPPPVRCREVGAADLDAVVDLLTGAFRHDHRSREFWAHALAQLSRHAAPPDVPEYGYLLESEGRIVGVLLLIFAHVPEGEEEIVRCNVSSWYVDPAFRGYAAMLAARALRHKDVTYLNITPAAHTLPMLEAQGYAQYSGGRFVSVPALAAGPRGCRVKSYAPEMDSGLGLSGAESRLLAAHARFGCTSLICCAAGRRHPFVFAPWRKYGLPCAYLVYCRELAEFVRFAGPLGRVLARRGYPLVIVDANGPVRSLVGIYSRTEPKFYKGPHPPRLGDLAYTERAMFGI